VDRTKAFQRKLLIISTIKKRKEKKLKLKKKKKKKKTNLEENNPLINYYLRSIVYFDNHTALFL